MAKGHPDLCSFSNGGGSAQNIVFKLPITKEDGDEEMVWPEACYFKHLSPDGKSRVEKTVDGTMTERSEGLSDTDRRLHLTTQ